MRRSHWPLAAAGAWPASQGLDMGVYRARSKVAVLNSERAAGRNPLNNVKGGSAWHFYESRWCVFVALLWW